MLFLDDRLLIGRGTNRACYVHPQEPDKCVKVTFSEDHSESEKEARYYKILQNRRVAWDMLARFYGTIDTDRGLGYIFELPRDYDGNVSKTIHHYIMTEQRTREIENPIPLFHQLKRYLLNEKIIVKDLNVANILYQRFDADHGRLIVVDGIGNNEFIPLSTYIDYFTVRKIQRRWTPFERSWFTKHQNNPYFITLLTHEEI